MKKALSLLLTVALVALTFSACTGGNDNTDSSDPTIKITYDSAYSNYDASVINGYQDICSAIIKGEASARVNTGMFSNIQRLVYTSFPLSHLVSSITVSSDKSGVDIEYKNDSDAHLALVKAFEDKINEIKDACGGDSANDSLYAVNLYNYIAKSIKVSDNDTISCYETIINGEGNSFTYSNMFEYLLLQKGIKAYHVIAYDMAQTPFGITQAVLGDGTYYFDIMSEFYANKGQNLVYFGMTTDDVKASGLNGMIYSNDEQAEDASDMDFDACRSCKSWKLNGSSLLVTRADNEVVEITLE